MERFSRTEALIGNESMEKLQNARVCVFGIGGVGGYVTEALARSGISHFLLVDSDSVSLTNINRQIIALDSTVGRPKVLVMRDRIHDINPKAEVEVKECFYLPENAEEFDFSKFDYIVDAVDTVTAKINIIAKAKESGVPVISAMGAGNKLDPTQFKVSDISKTKICPLAKVMRYELKKRGIKNVKVVYSEETPVNAQVSENGPDGQPLKKRAIPGSIAFSPSVMGLIIASEVVKDIACYK